MTNIILEKIIKKSHAKTLQQFTVFFLKNKAKFLIDSILKKKSTEIILEKKNNKTNTKKMGKNHVGSTVAIHSVL